jgi:hypothetical protein
MVKTETNTKIEFQDAELINFAKQFSDSYKNLKIGEYFSENSKYHIKYLPELMDVRIKAPLAVGARIEIKTGIIELNRFIFKSKEYTPDFLFYIIIWCVVRNTIEGRNDIRNADKMTVEYYLTTGRSIKNLAVGCLNLFSIADAPECNVERYKLIEQMLDKHCNL